MYCVEAVSAAVVWTLLSGFLARCGAGAALTTDHCTMEMYGDKLEFLIKALWIARLNSVKITKS